MGDNVNIETLLQKIDHWKKVKDKRYKAIRYPDLFYESIYKFNNLVGHEDIKKQMCEQICRIISMYMNPTCSEDNTKMNILIVGPPGVGKTTISKYLGGLWYSLGYLKPPNQIKRYIKKNPNSNPNSNPNNIDEDLEEQLYQISYSSLLIALALISAAFSLREIFSKQNNKAYFQIIFFILVITGAFFFFTFLGSIYKKYNREQYNEIKNGLNPTSNDNDEEKATKATKINPKKLLNPKLNDISVIAKADDFVSKYVGGTKPRTREFLENNRGRVIIFDEAYSLCQEGSNANMSYGSEALTVINEFMTEYPRDILFIFAGYKEDIQYNLFKKQQGLERRFGFKFECNGYNEEELFKIFKMQCNERGWKINDTEKVIDLFKSYGKKTFPAFGGTTERLLHQCESIKSSNVLDDNYVYDNIFTLDIIKKAMINMIKIQDSIKTPSTKSFRI